MKLGELIEYNKIDIFQENDAGRLVSDLFLFLKKAEHEVKASCSQLNFNIFR